MQNMIDPRPYNARACQGVAGGNGEKFMKS
jgi:hypothetical protein